MNDTLQDKTNETETLQDRVKDLVSQKGIHNAWETTYRVEGIEKLWERIYDDFVARINQPKGSHALDIGCGPGYNSIRLARRGYKVTSADYSEAVLPLARENFAKANLDINPTREDILNLSYPANSFDLVLCQGVLMHVPELERAISELSRVVKPGGYIVLEELNQGSPEARGMKLAWSLFKPSITITRKPSGDECTSNFEGKTLFWRYTNAKWFINEFAKHSCELFRRDSSMATETWKYAPGPFKSVVNGWNRLWLQAFNLPGLAYHNIFVFRKK